MKFTFTWTEVKEILIAAIVLSFAFALSSQDGLLNTIKNIDVFPVELFYAFVAVGIGFLAHELIGHKVVAQHLGMHGEFKMWRMGLYIALFSSFFGFVFAAPGAVYVSPKYDIWGRPDHVSNRKMGVISLAGPLVNLVLVGVFYILYQATPTDLFARALSINLVLGMFNMLPIPPLDGSKVMSWDKRIWVAVFGIFAALFVYFFVL